MHDTGFLRLQEDSVIKPTAMNFSVQGINFLNHSFGRIKWLTAEEKNVAEGLWVSPLTYGLTLLAQEFD